jgi:hypothetical protein
MGDLIKGKHYTCVIYDDVITKETKPDKKKIIKW